MEINKKPDFKRVRLFNGHLYRLLLFYGINRPTARGRSLCL